MADVSDEANKKVGALKEQCKSLSLEFESKYPDKTKGGALTFDAFIKAQAGWKPLWTFPLGEEVAVEVPRKDPTLGTRTAHWNRCARCGAALESKRVVETVRHNGDATGKFVRACESCGLFDTMDFDDAD